MRLLKTSAALQAAFCVHSAWAQSSVPPSGGSIAACHSQGCDACPRVASANEGYPSCLIYNSNDALGQDYASSSGNGYDVWWNSGAPNPSCKIIVRTPASTDLPACGYFLTSWNSAGCFYTAIQQSFMLQYCCGSGDCDAAAPARSVAEAHSEVLRGNTTIVSLAVGNLELLGNSGKRSIEGVGEINWKRSDHAYTKRAEVEVGAPKLVPRDCVFHPTSDKVTQGGQQVKASDTQTCNTQGGCSQAASVAVTEGQSISPSLSANLFSVISAAVGYTFMESKTYTVTTTYSQKQGTSGYMSYIPTLNCWDGTFSGCYNNAGDSVVLIPDDMSFHACTPATRSDGQLDGTFSFVYVN